MVSNQHFILINKYLKQQELKHKERLIILWIKKKNIKNQIGFKFIKKTKTKS